MSSKYIFVLQFSKIGCGKKMAAGVLGFQTNASARKSKSHSGAASERDAYATLIFGGSSPYRFHTPDHATLIPLMCLMETGMFGRYGIHHLTKERDIIAGRYQRRQVGPQFREVLVATGLVLVALPGLIAARLVA
ncbi:hypothetical protein FHT77_000354 [Rhizobium sp. BK181]|uniref:hypothetical protein n=1 Tax=Rhizobium sp. BK181 TaxID=2587072 RepID=UPI001618F2FD|nr:hypothetical protein [Rhizobium sp. BK181]MBB3314512.1 hypothetical protein [Rhizobium sp. BK181]